MWKLLTITILLNLSIFNSISFANWEMFTVTNNVTNKIIYGAWTDSLSVTKKETLFVRCNRETKKFDIFISWEDYIGDYKQEVTVNKITVRFDSNPPLYFERILSEEGTSTFIDKQIEHDTSEVITLYGLIKKMERYSIVTIMVRNFNDVKYTVNFPLSGSSKVLTKLTRQCNIK